MCHMSHMYMLMSYTHTHTPLQLDWDDLRIGRGETIDTNNHSRRTPPIFAPLPKP